MLLSEGHGFGLIPWFAELLGGNAHEVAAQANVIASLLVAAFLSVSVFFVWRRVRRPENYLVPDAKISFTNFFDVIVESLAKLMDDVMGHGGRKHLPLIGTIFFYILFSNMIGLIPGMVPPTSDLNTNLAIALSVFIYYNYCGIKAHGIGPYLKHFMGPMIWIAPLFFVIEIVSHCVRPLSLSIRLFGNMTADHAVLGVFTDMVPLGVPVIFLGLGLFVCLVQAFVFTLLSVVYIALAEAHVEEH